MTVTLIARSTHSAWHLDETCASLPSDKLTADGDGEMVPTHLKGIARCRQGRCVRTSVCYGTASSLSYRTFDNNNINKKLVRFAAACMMLKSAAGMPTLRR